jgi:hypothetical protein
MGTWGVGPFDNDSADELVEMLTAVEPAGRVETLSNLLSDSIEAEQNADPSEVVAAAVIVGACLPGSDLVSTYPTVATLLDSASAEGLSGAAIRALQVCLPESGWYWRSWAQEGDRLAARDIVTRVVAALNDHAEPQS